MDILETLTAEREIRNLKATYWYAMDTKNWEQLATVFADDCVFDLRGERAHSLGQQVSDLSAVDKAIAEKDPDVIIGGSNIANVIQRVAKKWITVHQGSTPIINVTGHDTAEAIWPIFDYIDDGKSALKGYGHYHDKYRKVGNRWLTSYVLLTRLRTDGNHPWATQ